jgi:Type IV secretion-system coupling protein DNA-binding domain
MMWRPKILFLTSLLTGIGAVALINEIAISRYPPAATLADGRKVAFNPDDIRGCMGARALASIGDETSHWQWQHCETVLAQVHALDGFALRYWSLLMASSCALVSAFGFALSARFESRTPRVLRGRRLLTGEAARRAFLRTTKAESALSGVGLELLPGLRISSERETRHLLIWGSPGAGKTQTMLHAILAAIARGDGVLVLDVKGEMTPGLPGDPLIVAPQDERSLVWDVANDCRTKQDARELAARLIPPSEDPLWSEAARDVLVACVASLQATKPGAWTWRDLHTLATSDQSTLLAHARTYHRDAARLLETR